MTCTLAENWKFHSVAVAMAVAVVGWDAAGCGNQRHTGLSERAAEGQGNGDKRRDSVAGLQGHLSWSPTAPSPSLVCQTPLGSQGDDPPLLYLWLCFPSHPYSAAS